MEAFCFHNTSDIKYILHFNNFVIDIFIYSQTNFKRAKGALNKDLYLIILFNYSVYCRVLSRANYCHLKIHLKNVK